MSCRVMLLGVRIETLITYKVGNKASPHTPAHTMASLKGLRKKYGFTLDPQNIPVKGVDISPMDFFDYLKQLLKCRKGKSLYQAV